MAIDKSAMLIWEDNVGYLEGVELAGLLWNIENGRTVWHVVFGGGTVAIGLHKIDDAKAAAEIALTEWLQSTNFAHVPDGHQIVPIEPSEEQLKAGQAAYDRKIDDMHSPTPTEEYEAGGGPMGYAYHAMCSKMNSTRRRSFLKVIKDAGLAICRPIDIGNPMGFPSYSPVSDDQVSALLKAASQNKEKTE